MIGKCLGWKGEAEVKDGEMKKTHILKRTALEKGARMERKGVEKEGGKVGKVGVQSLEEGCSVGRKD